MSTDVLVFADWQAFAGYSLVFYWLALSEPLSRQSSSAVTIIHS